MSTPLCGAKKKNGERCRAFAGQKTDHPGIGNCAYHGGSTPTHRAAALVTEARQKAATLGHPIDIDAETALMGMLRATAGHVAFLGAEVADLDGLGDDRARVTVALYADERDRCARIAKACLDAGISRRQVERTKNETEQVAHFLKAVVSRLDLTAEQQAELGPAIRAELGTVNEQAVEAAA